MNSKALDISYHNKTIMYTKVPPEMWEIMTRKYIIDYISEIAMSDVQNKEWADEFNVPRF